MCIFDRKIFSKIPQNKKVNVYKKQIKYKKLLKVGKEKEL